MMFRDPALACACCHSDDLEVVASDVMGFVVLCNECGYAQVATLGHLLAG